MISVKTVALFALPLGLMAGLWAVAIPNPDSFGDIIGRLSGILLLGGALLAILLVFRVSAREGNIAPRRHLEPMAPREFRRGFAGASSARRKHPVLRSGVIVTLHRSGFEQRAALRRRGFPPAIAAETIETLSQRLHDRAAKLWHGRV
jgi:hypothetical protein